jgi:hypothetical protein
MSSQLTRRGLVSRIRLVYLVTASLALFVAPPMQAGSAPAAKGPVPVRIELTGKAGARGAAGRFTLSAWPGTIALVDRGRFVDHGKFPLVRTLYGTKGTIEITVPRSARPRLMLWRISKGTKAYAGLGGQGTQTVLYGPPSAQRSMRVTMFGMFVWGLPPIG